jgi:hypothetical protein
LCVRFCSFYLISLQTLVVAVILNVTIPQQNFSLIVAPRSV